MEKGSTQAEHLAGRLPHYAPNDTSLARLEAEARAAKKLSQNPRTNGHNSLPDNELTAELMTRPQVVVETQVRAIRPGF